MTDMCKAGLWDIDNGGDCPLCGAKPDADCDGEKTDFDHALDMLEDARAAAKANPDNPRGHVRLKLISIGFEIAFSPVSTASDGAKQ